MYIRPMLAVACLCALGTAQAGERAGRKRVDRRTQGPGLAAKYPGDKGIEKDPSDSVRGGYGDMGTGFRKAARSAHTAA
ncbi:MAG TPA: hypothetical protein VFB21_20370 [Chthonomonadaceae bacterium]|nr:hypothetical protein [Chthonomonadaceae bacterium]